MSVAVAVDDCTPAFGSDMAPASARQKDKSPRGPELASKQPFVLGVGKKVFVFFVARFLGEILA